MDFKRLYTRFDGRIGRRDYWIGFLVLIAAGFAVSLVLTPVLGPFVASILINLALIYPATAVVAKRLHDRDKPTIPWVPIFVGIPILVNIVQLLGVGSERITVPREQVEALPNALPAGDGLVSIPVPNALGVSLSAVAVIFGLWALVELGFLRGTSGPNRFGPDPVADDHAAHA